MAVINDRISSPVKMGTAMDILKYEIAAQMKGVAKQVPCLAGKPGIGKTESIEALTKQIGHEFIPVQLSAVFAEEFSGIPDFQNAPSELAREWSLTGDDSAKFTKWSIPELVTMINMKARRARMDGKGVVVLFDDIHAADVSIERFMFNLLRQRRIGHYQLEDNVYLVAAMNDSSAAGFRGFNAAVLDRLAVYSVEFDFDYWYNKVMGDKIHPVIAAFLKLYHQQYMLGEEDTEKITPSPRSWTELSFLLSYMGDVYDQYLSAIASSRIGIDAAAELVKFNITYKKFNFDYKLEKGIVEEIDDDLTTQILYANIVRHVRAEKHAQIVIDTMIKNMDKPQFITSLIQEFAMLINLDKSLLRKNKGIKKIYNIMTAKDTSIPDELRKYIDDGLYAAYGVRF